MDPYAVLICRSQEQRSSVASGMLDIWHILTYVTLQFMILKYTALHSSNPISDIAVLKVVTRVLVLCTH